MPSPSIKTPEPKTVYLEKTYSQKRRDFLIIGIITQVIAVPWLYFGIRMTLDVGTSKLLWWQLPLPLFFGLGIPALFVWTGLMLIYGWMTNRIYRLTITELGIKYGRKFRPWDSLSVLSWYPVKRNQLSLYCRKRGFYPFDLFLEVDDLGEAEINDLFQKLNEDIVPHFPNLRIG